MERSFALEHRGTMTGGTLALNVSVLTISEPGRLAGIRDHRRHPSSTAAIVTRSIARRPTLDAAIEQIGLRVIAVLLHETGQADADKSIQRVCGAVNPCAEPTRNIAKFAR